MNKKFVKISALFFLLSASFCAYARPVSLKSHGFTEKEQISADKAITFSRVQVRKLNANLAKAYGAQAIFIPPAKHKRGTSTLSRTRSRGAHVIRQLAAYEPLKSVCAVDSGDYYLMTQLSKETVKLLLKRGLATPEEAARWARRGGDEGFKRLGAVTRLNCVPVRAAFNASVPGFENAYIVTRAALSEAPVPKKPCGCSN